LLLDSIGGLAGLYSLAEVAIVGGGFLWPGGHNPLEPAQFGVPTLIGAHYANFREVVEALREAEAIAVASPDELASAVSNILTHRQQALAMGQRARQVFEQQAGATQRALTALLALCEASRPSAQSEAVQVAP
ncbi:MAG TPA: glycosyltransferase, partial [Acidobacteriaceae bacterium]